MRGLIAIVCVSLLSACASPADGPKGSAFRNGRVPGTNERIPVVALANAPMGQAVLAYAPGADGLSALRSPTAADMRLKRGDVIEVTIFDTGEEALFSSTDSKSLPLGRFTVDPTGSITLPFVGRRKVVDTTPEAVQVMIVDALKGSSVNPQAVVSVLEKPSNAINVSGGVKTPGLFPLSAKRERVLDALTLAGGASGEAANITIVRGSARATVPLARIKADQAQNVVLAAGDQVIVDGDKPSFTAFGAFKSVGEFEFEPGKLTLAQALARAGGLLDSRADPGNFYVLRNQPVAPQAPVEPVAQAVSMAKAPPEKTVLIGRKPAPVVQAVQPTTSPVIYHVNLKDVSNFLLMQRFYVQNGDILYASNARLVDNAKLFTALQKGAETAAAPPPAPK